MFHGDPTTLIPQFGGIATLQPPRIDIWTSVIQCSCVGAVVTVAAPVRWSWQGIDRSLVASARACSQNIVIYNFIITIFDSQGGSQSGGISARAFALAPPGVAPPLGG